MNFPVWDPAFGTVWIMVLVGVFHVFISHFAIGGGLFLVVVETRAHRLNDLGLLEWLKRHSRFFVYATLVLGALSGVGLWFTVALISPEATLSLVRTFLWVWAVEWVLFLVEILSILVYAYSWESLERRTHRLVGWVYFLASFASLVAVAPILSFQLTPGRWLATHSLLPAFFNPGFLPSIVLRSLVCLMLGGLFSMLTVSWEKDRPLRMEVAKYASLWVWIPALLVAPATYWYLSSVPLQLRRTVITDTFVRHFTEGLILMGGLVVLLSLALVWFRPRFLNLAVAMVLLVLAFGAVGALEWVREDLRKPYLISGDLYANHVPVASLASVRQKGLLASCLWTEAKAVTPGREVRAGHEVFLIACSSCHRPVKGMNPLGPAVKGLDESFLAATILKSEIMRHAMPPFPGKPEEADALARYLLVSAPLGPPAMGGRAVWGRRCGFCHTLKGPERPVKPFFLGKTQDEVSDILGTIDSLNAAMPRWTGSPAEKEALAHYLATLTPVKSSGAGR